MTPVIFRYWKKEIIALFPTIQSDVNGLFCESYMHVGQHSGADYYYIVSQSRLAKLEEYKHLLEELKSIGYDDLKVYKRCQRSWKLNY